MSVKQVKISLVALLIATVIPAPSSDAISWQRWNCANKFSFEVTPPFQRGSSPWPKTRRFRFQNLDLNMKLINGADNDSYNNGSYRLVFWKDASFWNGQQQIGVNCNPVN